MEDKDDYKDSIQKFRYEIVQRLQLDRTSMFDYLRSKGVFDASDCELVFVEKTREQKASRFLDILESKGKEGFVYFIDVLQLLNPGLYESITGKKASKYGTFFFCLFSFNFRVCLMILCTCLYLIIAFVHFDLTKLHATYNCS